MCEAQPQGWPFTLSTSFMPIGMPPSGRLTSAVAAEWRAPARSLERYAWIFGSYSSIRAASASMTSVGVNSRARSAVRRAATERKGMSCGVMARGWALVDDLRHHEQVIGLARRVGQRLGGGQSRPHLVLAEYVEDVAGVRGGLHPGDVDRFQFFDEGEHLTELILKRPCFLVGEIQAGQRGHVADVKFG